MAKPGSTLVYATLFAAANVASAQNVSFSIPDGYAGLENTLRRASLTLSLVDDDEQNAQDIVAAARADYRRLLTGLYAKGYYGGSVSILIDGREAARIAPLDAPASVENVQLIVAPGPRFEFGNTEIRPLAPETELPEGFAPGALAFAEVVRDATTAAIMGWRDLGYAKAEVSAQSIRAVHNSERLDVAIAIDSGPKLSFGTLQPTGNLDVRSARIIEIAGLPTGETFSPAELDRATARLRRTGAFSSVALLEAEDYSVDHALQIEAQVSEEQPRRFGFGVEYSTTDGLSLSSYWMHRNFFGGAENLRIEGDISGLTGETGGTDYILAADFKRPATLHPDNDFLVGAELMRLDEPDYVLDQASFEIGFARQVNPQRQAAGRIGFVTAHVEDDLGTRNYQLLTFPIEASEDRRDNPFDAQSGAYLSLELTPFLGFGDVGSGARTYADARYYKTFGDTRTVTFAARGQIGSILNAALGDAPSDYLFYSGGGDTVRGQPYQSLNVDLGGGNSTGGLSFAATSLEARIAVTEKIGVVGFYDAGFVGETAMPFEDGDWHAGAGLGVRYKTSLGPIRLDLATPASGSNAGQSLSIYVGIGQAF